MTPGAAENSLEEDCIPVPFIDPLPYRVAPQALKPMQ